ncbi:hypothetical protein EYF80_055826 [Liparis tanakae]|uniref:Uncharacterized protein n=1 Tax=Liparis tanakae TaxID=230148 RepID=A0A4Z2EZ13_9TELE|nr:hypothetical protein EYF80_055826 [Liparis tanakae]
MESSAPRSSRFRSVCCRREISSLYTFSRFSSPEGRSPASFAFVASSPAPSPLGESAKPDAEVEVPGSTLASVWRRFTACCRSARPKVFLNSTDERYSGDDLACLVRRKSNTSGQSWVMLEQWSTNWEEREEDTRDEEATEMLSFSPASRRGSKLDTYFIINNGIKMSGCLMFCD